MPAPQITPEPINTGPRGTFTSEIPQLSVQPEAAVDRAMQESISLNDVNSFMPSLEGNLKDSKFLLDITKQLHGEIQSQILQTSFAGEVKAAKTNEELASILQRYERTIDKPNSDIRTISYIEFLKHAPQNDYSMDAYNRYRTEIETPESLDQARYSVAEDDLNEMRQILDSYSAEQGYEFDSVLGVREAGKELLKATLLPFQEVVLNQIAVEAGAPSTSILAGEDRENTREWLRSLDPEGKKQFLERFTTYLREKEGDPIYSQLLTDFAVWDYFESVLNDEVLAGQASPNQVDRWINNAITALDTLWVGGAIVRGVKRVAGQVLRLRRPIELNLANRGSTRTGRMADKVSTPTASSVSDTVRNNPEVAGSLKIPEEEILARNLPVPENMADDTIVIPDKVQEILPDLESGRTQAQLLAGEGPRTWATDVVRKEQIHQEIDTIIKAQRGVLRPRSSTIKYLDDQKQGFRVRLTFGATELSGWKGETGLSDMIAAIQGLDNVSNKIDLFIKSPTGTLKKIFDVNQQVGALDDLPLLEEDLLRSTRIKPNSEFFYKVTHERLFTPEDKIAFGEDPVLRTGLLPEYTLGPNAMFSKEVYMAAEQAFSVEQKLAQIFNDMLKPLWDLPTKSLQKVYKTFNFTNEFAKQTGRNPTLVDYKAEFPDLTPDEMKALYAMRYTQDTWYMNLQHNLYRNWREQGFITAYNDNLPNFHGKLVDRNVAERLFLGTNSKGVLVYDPLTKSSVPVTDELLNNLYSGEGGILKLDSPIEVPSSPRNKHYYVIASTDAKSGYQLGKLSHNVLDYHPGYFIKLYEEPYFIVKKYNTVTIDGVSRAVSPGRANSPDFSVAIHTAPSLKDAQRLVKAANNRLVTKGKSDYSYEVVFVKDLATAEKDAQIAQLLQRQGRMFLDKRDYRMLRNIYGQEATLMDPIQSMERAVGSMARMLTQEQTIRALKNKFRQQYGHLVDNKAWLTQDSQTILESLKREKINELDPTKEKVQDKAVQLWQYIRMLEGVDSNTGPEIRKWLLNRFTEMKWPNKWRPDVEDWILNASPLDAVRSVTFKAFMATKPFRQKFMQAAQILWLGGINPTYVYSGAIIKDAIAVRIGLSKMRGIDGGWKPGKLAAMMGLTEEEYTTVLKAMDRSGLMQHVDVHSYAGGSRREKHVPLGQGAVGKAVRPFKRFGKTVVNTLIDLGFNSGERDNLALTYLFALRQYLERNNKKIQALTLDEWDSIRHNASNLAGGMVRVNQKAYQYGPLALTTQFLSFSHNIMLQLIGMNPAIKSWKDVRRLWINGAVMFGAAGMFGIGEYVSSWLSSLEKDKQIPPIKPQVRNYIESVISYGLIDRFLNDLGSQLTNGNWDELNYSGMAPGPGGLINFYNTLIEGFTEGGTSPLEFVLGPTSTLTGRILPAIVFANKIFVGNPDMPDGEKFLVAGNEILKGALPGYNDANQAYNAYILEQWYSQAGGNSDIRPQMNALIAKGVLGVNPKNLENAWWVRGQAYEHTAALQDRVKEDSAFIQKLINLYTEGGITYDDLFNRAIIIGNFVNELPDKDKVTYFRMMNSKEYNDFSLTEYLTEQVRKGNLDRSHLSIINTLPISQEDKDIFEQIMNRFDSELSETNEYLQREIDNFSLEHRKNAN